MAESRTGAFATSRNYYEQAKSKGVDAPFVEYLTLATLINVIISQGLYQPFGYTRTRFEKLGRLVKLRNDVAHSAPLLSHAPLVMCEAWGEHSAARRSACPVA